MRYNRGVVLSTVVALLVTGCVKPTGEANTTHTATTGTDTQTFEDTATNGTFAPTYAEDDVNINAGSGTVYGVTEVDNSSVISTDATYGAIDTYNNSVATDTTTYDTTPTYGTDTTYDTTGAYDNVAVTPTPTTPSYGTAGGAYGNPNTTNSSVYSSNNDIYGTNTSTNSGGYNDTYSPVPTPAALATGGYNNTYSSTPSTSRGTYTTNNAYAGGGIQLQVAALKDYYAAEEYKNNLSLDPKYSAYVKKGRINKVIVTGLPSRAAAKALAAKQFPGAFIVGGSPLSSSAASSSYNNSYSSSTTTSSSSANSSSSYSGNGIGVQVGAFSSYASAKSAAKNAAGGRYTALVKTVDSRGKKLYKAIVTGFSSASAARSAIASGEFGSAFLVTNLK